MCIRTENLNCRRLTKHFKQERFFTFMITIYIYIYIYVQIFIRCLLPHANNKSVLLLNQLIYQDTLKLPIGFF